METQINIILIINRITVSASVRDRVHSIDRWDGQLGRQALVERWRQPIDVLV